MGFFLRPKDTNLDREHNHLNAEPVEMAAGAQDRYSRLGGGREALKSAPLPSGNWRGGSTKTGKVGRSR